MKKRKVIYPLFAILLFLAVAVVIAQAAGSAGSSSDPLVTKSYVDQQIAQLSARIGSSGTSSGTGAGTADSAEVAQLKTDVGDLTKFVIDAMTDLNNVKSSLAIIQGGYTVVQLNKGQKIILDSGAEVILRSGQAQAIKGQNGSLVDVSSGTDLNDGANIPLQHLIITPRGDGRGMLMKANAYVIVRGGYTVQ